MDTIISHGDLPVLATCQCGKILKRSHADASHDSAMPVRYYTRICINKGFIGWDHHAKLYILNTLSITLSTWTPGSLCNITCETWHDKESIFRLDLIFYHKTIIFQTRSRRPRKVICTILGSHNTRFTILTL